MGLFDELTEKQAPKSQDVITGMLAMASSEVRNGNYTRAIDTYKKILELEANADAQYMLGECYYYGHGAEQDYAEAVKWFRKAAEQGRAYAQYMLGGCYYYGDGEIQDYAEAVKWFRKAAEQGHAGAQCDLGHCYCYGHGVEPDYKEAAKWLIKAGARGHTKAQRELLKLYAELSQSGSF